MLFNITDNNLKEKKELKRIVICRVYLCWGETPSKDLSEGLKDFLQEFGKQKQK